MRSIAILSGLIENDDQDGSQEQLIRMFRSTAGMARTFKLS